MFTNGVSANKNHALATLLVMLLRPENTSNAYGDDDKDIQTLKKERKHDVEWKAYLLLLKRGGEEGRSAAQAALGTGTVPATTCGTSPPR